MAERMVETQLYAPVKHLLESQGYEVKSEVGAADIMAIRGEEPPVIVELKTGFSLALLHQAIERLKITDMVYLAIPEWKGRSGWKAFVSNRKLCRRLGLGLITVDGNCENAQVHLDPGPYQPKKSKIRQSRMLREFQHRVGDPNEGGSTRKKLMTGYRQDALRCLKMLSENGAMKASEVAKDTGVTRARAIMADDYYGWFERAQRGIYAVTPKGEKALAEYAEEVGKL